MCTAGVKNTAAAFEESPLHKPTLFYLVQIPALKLELLTFDLGGRAPSVQALKSYDTGEEQVGINMFSNVQHLNPVDNVL